MPINDYYCKQCDKKITDILSTEEKILCPYCGGRVVKLPGIPAIRFKGSGFYANDYSGKCSTGSCIPATKRK